VDMDPPLDTTRNDVMEYCEKIFLVIFTCEAIVKIIALTPCGGPKAYFTDYWNWMDAFIVASGWPTVFIGEGAGGTTILRTLRVIKPLRTISHIKELNVLIDSLTQSGAKLVPVLGLFCFVFLMFAITGLQLFQGVMNQRCYLSTTINGTTSYTLNEDFEDLCSENSDCPGTGACIVSDSSPNNDITNFNDIGHALLTFFVATTTEGWVDVMYMVQDSYSYILSTVYFFLCIMIANMVVLELAKGVIQDRYSDLALSEGLDDEVESDDEDVWEQTALEGKGMAKSQKLASHRARYRQLRLNLLPVGASVGT